MAKKFRKWAGNILDDIIFNESKELKLQIENKDNNLLHEFTSKYNCKTECGIGDKSLSKALITNNIYNGYYYKYLEERLVL